MVVFRFKLVGWDVVGVPIIYIDQPGGRLIMIAVHGAFHYIVIFTAQGNDWPRPAIFATATRNGFGYGDITSHEYGDYYDATVK